MARPRTPASQLNPDSLAHNKGRFAARSLEPKTFGELGRPSKWLSPAEKKTWRTLLRSAPAQIGENDRTLLEIAVVLKAKLEAGRIENSQITQLIQCLTKLGMVPQIRQTVQPEPDAAPDEWDLLDTP
jgi:hypothetical protein